MNFIFLFIALLIHPLSFSQEEKKKTVHIRSGLELRATPIYLKPVPDIINAADRNVHPQEGQHLSGLAFIYSIEKETPNNLSIVFNQQIRYDFLYSPLPFGFQSWPDPAFRTDDKNGLFTDLSLEVLRSFSNEKSRFKIGVGAGVAGIGSNYLLTEAYKDNSGNYFLVTTKEHYIYPYLSGIFAFQFKNFQTHLRANYTRHFPGYFHGKEFIQPQLSVLYRLLSF